MIESKDLRIGNYVDYEATTHVISAIGHTESWSYWLKNKTGSNDEYLHQNSELKPIAITDEWLIKFGFKISSTGFIEKGRLLYHKEYGWKILENWVKGWVGVTEIIYVHQLQNLYFALIGVELVAEPTQITQTIN